MISKRTIAKIILLIGDLMLLYGSLTITLFIRYYDNPDFLLISQRHVIPFSIAFLAWLALFGAFGLYDLRLAKNSKIFLLRLLRAVASSVVITIVIFYFAPIFLIEPRRNLFIIAAISTVLIFSWRYFFNLLIIRTPASRILFFGLTREAAELSDWLLKNPQLGQKPIAFLSPNGENTLPQAALPHFSSASDLLHIVKDFKVDTIVVLREIKENKTLVSALFQVIPLRIGVVEFPAFHEALTGKIPLSLIGEVWFLENLVGVKKTFYEFFKRWLDIMVALIASVPAILIFPLLVLAIKTDSEGPIFYRQKRVGRHGKEFFVIKYRTMVKDAEKMSGWKGEGPDPRHTRVGKFLRKSYMDELPQIINILRGDMSFMGPRPERPHYVSELKQKIPFYEMRLLVPPGITGWAQVNMENDASVEDAPEKMQYDLYYVKNRSFALDFVIILRTLRIILQRQGR